MPLVFLPASTTLTPEQALQSSLQVAPELDQVMIIGTYPNGGLFIRSSRLTCAEALWLAERAKLHALNNS